MANYRNLYNTCLKGINEVQGVFHEGMGSYMRIGICKVIGERQGNVTTKHITDGNYC